MHLVHTALVAMLGGMHCLGATFTEGVGGGACGTVANEGLGTRPFLLHFNFRQKKGPRKDGTENQR